MLGLLRSAHCRLKQEGNMANVENPKEIGIRQARLCGELQEKVLDAVHGYFAQEANPGDTVVVNLSEITEVPAVSLPILMRTYLRLKKMEIRLVFICPSPVVLNALRKSHLLEVLPVYHNPEEFFMDNPVSELRAF